MTRLPYNRDAEAAELVRELVRLRPRLQRLARNLDLPRSANAALRHLDLASESLAEIKEWQPGPLGVQE